MSLTAILTPVLLEIANNVEELVVNGNSAYFRANLAYSIANSILTASTSASVRQTFTATASQTTFTVSGGYYPNQLDVYQNGVKLYNGVDVGLSSGTNVVLTTGASINDIIDVVGYIPIGLSDAVRKIGDTMSGPLIVSNNITIGGHLDFTNNISIGSSNITTGVNNIVIGYNCGIANAANSNQLNIGNFIHAVNFNGYGNTSPPQAKMCIGGLLPGTNQNYMVSILKPAVEVTMPNGAVDIRNYSTNSTTDGLAKYALVLASNGTFTGGGGANCISYGLYISDVSGADMNIPIYHSVSGAMLTSAGIWTNAASYRKYKDTFTDSSFYLDKLKDLDIYEWQYKNEEIGGLNRYKDDNKRHISPFLDDFHNTFNVGMSDGFNIQDLAGVSLACVKELNNRFEECKSKQDNKIKDLELKILNLTNIINKLKVD